MANALRHLLLPLLLFPLWGLFACIVVAWLVAYRSIARLGFGGTLVLATVVQVALFTPVMAVAEGGNIPVLFPLLAIPLSHLIGLFEPGPGTRWEFGSFIVISTPLALVISAVATYFAQRRLRKQRIC